MEKLSWSHLWLRNIDENCARLHSGPLYSHFWIWWCTHAYFWTCRLQLVPGHHGHCQLPEARSARVSTEFIRAGHGSQKPSHNLNRSRILRAQWGLAKPQTLGSSLRVGWGQARARARGLAWLGGTMAGQGCGELDTSPAAASAVQALMAWGLTWGSGLWAGWGEPQRRLNKDSQG